MNGATHPADFRRSIRSSSSPRSERHRSTWILLIGAGWLLWLTWASAVVHAQELRISEDCPLRVLWNRRWESPRIQPRFPYLIDGQPPRFVFPHDDRVYVIDVGTGRTESEIPGYLVQDGAARAANVSAPRHLVVNSMEESRCVHMETGDVVWRGNVAEYGEVRLAHRWGSRILLESMQDRLGILHLLELDPPRTAWRKTITEYRAGIESNASLLLGDQLLLRYTDRVLSLDVSSGSTRWEFAVRGAGDSMTRLSDRTVLLTHLTGQQVVDVANGESVSDHPLSLAPFHRIVESSPYGTRMLVSSWSETRNSTTLQVWQLTDVGISTADLGIGDRGLIGLWVGDERAFVLSGGRKSWSLTGIDMRVGEKLWTRPIDRSESPMFGGLSKLGSVLVVTMSWVEDERRIVRWLCFDEHTGRSSGTVALESPLNELGGTHTAKNVLSHSDVILLRIGEHVWAFSTSP